MVVTRNMALRFNYFYASKIWLHSLHYVPLVESNAEGAWVKPLTDTFFNFLYALHWRFWRTLCCIVLGSIVACSTVATISTLYCSMICLSVCLSYVCLSRDCREYVVLWQNGWMDRDEVWHTDTLQTLKSCGEEISLPISFPLDSMRHCSLSFSVPKKWNANFNFAITSVNIHRF